MGISSISMSIFEYAFFFLDIIRKLGLSALSGNLSADSHVETL